MKKYCIKEYSRGRAGSCPFLLTDAEKLVIVEIMRHLFENKKQKTVWILYILVIVLIYLSISNTNRNYYQCRNQGFDCSLLPSPQSPFPPIIITTIVAIVLALLFQSEDRQTIPRKTQKDTRASTEDRDPL